MHVKYFCLGVRIRSNELHKLVNNQVMFTAKDYLNWENGQKDNLSK